METTPLISCICVTYEKPDFLKTALDCFRSQTYPSRELVILYQDDDTETKTFLSQIDDKNILAIEVEASSGLSLGAKRNMAIERSRGDFFCTWDDDDWSHPDRLLVQMKAIQETHKDACVLIYILLYHSVKREAYLSFSWPWENTLMCRKEVFQLHRYGDANRSEDATLLRKLLLAKHVCPVFTPNLYIYVNHGKNVWGNDHFARFYAQSQKLSSAWSDLIASMTNGDLTPPEGAQQMSGPLLQEFDYFKTTKLNY